MKPDRVNEILGILTQDVASFTPQRLNEMRCRLKIRKKRRIIAAYKRFMGCAVCGYARCSRSLDLHHSQPTQKRGISNDMYVASWYWGELLLTEPLCRNCHGEVHAQHAPWAWPWPRPFVPGYGYGLPALRPSSGSP
jgi:hypothetical protein